MEALRRQNYETFRKNLEKAFNEYDTDRNALLSRAEFSNFMAMKAKEINHHYKEETINQLFDDMDVNRDQAIDK